MSKLLITALLVLSSVLAPHQAYALNNDRIHTRAIQKEYKSQNNGRMIPNVQLNYYLEQLDAGWSMKQIRRDITTTHELTRKNPNYIWYPTTNANHHNQYTNKIDSQNNNNQVNSYSVTCTSDKKAPTHCIWDDHYGEPRIVQQLSRKKCVKGKNWAYHSNRDLWVTKGCSARFVSSL